MQRLLLIKRNVYCLVYVTCEIFQLLRVLFNLCNVYKFIYVTCKKNINYNKNISVVTYKKRHTLRKLILYATDENKCTSHLKITVRDVRKFLYVAYVEYCCNN